MEAESLRQRTQRSLAWSGINRFASQIFGFGVQILLARLLPIEEFGLVATIGIFVFIAQILVDGGFGDALVQSNEISRQDISSVFFLNLFVAGCSVAVLFLTAPYIANYFREPRLSNILRVLSVDLLITASCMTQLKLLTRHLQFRRIFVITICAQIIGGVVGVAMALGGFNVWSLVFQTLCVSAVTSIVTWIVCDREWRPQFDFHADSVRRLAPFGMGMLGANLVACFQQNMYGLLIAKKFSMSDLAYYNRAQQIQRVSVQSLTIPLVSVLFPAFSSIQNAHEKIVATLRKGLPVLCFCIFPIMFLQIVTAESLIIVVFTKVWLPTAPYLKLLSLVGLSYPPAAVNVAVLRALGKSRLFFQMTVVQCIAALLTLVVTSTYGIHAIIVGQIAIAWSAYVASAFFVGRLIRYSFGEQLACVGTYAAANILSMIVTVLLTRFVVDLPTVRLLAQFTIFTATYLVLSWSLGLKGFVELCHIAPALFGRILKPLSQRRA